MKRKPVTKENLPEVLITVLNREEQRKAKIANIIAWRGEYGEIPQDISLDRDDQLSLSVIYIAISQDGINGANTKAIKEAYKLGDDDIDFILHGREAGEMEEDTSDSSSESNSTPLLPFANPDGTPQDLDKLDNLDDMEAVLERLEKLATDNIKHRRGDNQFFGISKVLQLSRRAMGIPAGQKRADYGFNVAPRKAKDQIIVPVTWRLVKEVAKDFQLTFFDMRVENAVYNLLEDGQKFPTLDQIVRELDFMAGDHDVSNDRCKKVFESLKRLGMLMVEIDYTEQMRMKGLAKDGGKYTIGGTVVPTRWGKIERNNGKGKIEKIGVEILAPPIFTEYSKKVNQVVTVPREIMMAATTKQYDGKGNKIEGTGTLSNTQVVGDYIFYMAYQLKRIANTANHKILYDTIFEDTGDTLPMEKTAQGRKARSERRGIIKKLLDAWKAVGFIRNWKPTKTKGAENGVEITMFNPLKGLKAPEKQQKGVPEKH